MPPDPSARLYDRAAVVVALPVLVAAALLLPALDRVPGVNGDEAWVLERVDELRSGLRPVNGMTFYVAALHQYLVWPFVELFGRTIFAVRLPGALLNLAAVGLVAFATCRRFGNLTGLFAGLLLATAPAFATLARFGIEVPGLTPFLAALAFACFAGLDRDRGLRAGALALVGGAALGVIAYNHVVLTPAIAALAVAALVGLRTRLVRAPAFYFALAGLLLGAAPRIQDALDPGMLQHWRNPELRASSFTGDLLPALALLLRCWHGELIYQRFAGGSDLFVIYYPELALAALIIARRRLGLARGWLRVEWLLLAATALAALLLAALAPHLSIRYAIIMHMALPVALAIVARPLLLAEAARVRRLAVLTLAGVVALNLLYLTVNFFVPFATRGGGISVFPIGTRLIENSNHFARTDLLHAQLRARGVRRVEADWFMVRPMRMYDRFVTNEGSRGPLLEFAGVEPAFNAPGRARVKSAVVFYNGPLWSRPEPPMPTEDARRYGDEIERAGLKLRRDPSFPPLFRVYLVEGAE